MFRAKTYRAQDRSEFLRDLIGLANAGIEGPRYLFLGIEDAPGSDRAIVGIPHAEIRSLHELSEDLVSRFIEPSLIVRIDEVEIDGTTVPVVVLPDCNDPPYLLKKNVSGSRRMGAGWLRQGTTFRRLQRSDLQLMFERKLRTHAAGAQLRVGFGGKTLMSSISLAVMPLDRLPSQQTRGRYEKLLAAKNVSRGARGEIGSRIERLVHAQVFGEGQPYSPSSTATLVRRLRSTENECEAADRYYAHEIRAHKINVILENIGDATFDRGTLVLDMPRLDGVEIPTRVAPEPGSEGVPADSYPVIEVGPRVVRVQAIVGPVPPGAKVAAFAEALRICLREPAAGATLPVEFGLHGKMLRTPLTGVLRIEIAGA